ncbi:hypothetical protein OPT61_g7098 [Boeremia exigua]|uniref:Uncharacterized protein n=1 Tax=Boeremia exigua TaxID=749465 RepID=A0ACC2I3R9_9PLEO|nr:hypothetical protein OPT61_g7098 [Boeremia exigua]
MATLNSTFPSAPHIPNISSPYVPNIFTPVIPNISTPYIPSLFNYDPNKPAAIIGALGFIAIEALHAWQFKRYRAWHFWAMVIGVLVQSVGSGARATAVYRPDDRASFFTGYIALLLVPCFVTIACYTTFGRLVFAISVATTLLTLIASLVTVIGASIVATKYLGYKVEEDSAQAGLNALKAGLMLQLISLTAFNLASVWFVSASRYWVSTSVSSAAYRLGRTVVSATVLLAVSVLYWIVELYSSSESTAGYVARSEWPFWVFGTVPMIGACVSLAGVHPGHVLPREYLGFYVKRDGRDSSEDSDDEFIV